MEQRESEMDKYHCGKDAPVENVNEERQVESSAGEGGRHQGGGAPLGVVNDRCVELSDVAGLPSVAALSSAARVSFQCAQFHFPHLSNPTLLSHGYLPPLALKRNRPPVLSPSLDSCSSPLLPPAGRVGRY